MNASTRMKTEGVMYTLMQLRNPAPKEPPHPGPAPAQVSGPPGAASRGGSAEQDDWPPDVHLPDEYEEEEC